jgi:four helix bundle protein
MNNEKIQSNPIVNQTLEFALLINKYTDKLRELHHWDLGRQLFRSGTSIGANVWEAQNSESKADFVHKMKISAKEANETLYWLLICSKSENYPDCSHLLDKLESVNKILSAIIATTKKSNPLSFMLGYFLFWWKPASSYLFMKDLIAQ